MEMGVVSRGVREKNSGSMRMQYEIIAATSSGTPRPPVIHADGYPSHAAHHMDLFAEDLSYLQNDDGVDVASSQDHLSPDMADAMDTEIGDKSLQQELVDRVGNNMVTLGQRSIPVRLHQAKVMMELRFPSIYRMGT